MTMAVDVSLYVHTSVSIQIKFACFFAKFVELFANLRQVLPICKFGKKQICRKFYKL